MKQMPLTDTIHNKRPTSHKTLLRIPRHIRHPHAHDQTRHRRKKPDQSVPRQRRSAAFAPLAFPDHGAAGHDGQAAEHQHDQADVLEEQAGVAAGEDGDEADGAEGHLPEEGGGGGVAEGADDEGAEGGDCAVYWEDGWVSLRALNVCVIGGMSVSRALRNVSDFL